VAPLDAQAAAHNAVRQTIAIASQVLPGEGTSTISAPRRKYHSRKTIDTSTGVGQNRE
jgi:hypothetical protein